MCYLAYLVLDTSCNLDYVLGTDLLRSRSKNIRSAYYVCASVLEENISPTIHDLGAMYLSYVDTCSFR